MKLTDLHIHSTFSDGKLSIPQLVDFYGSRGFKIISITDHLCEEDTFLGKSSRFFNKTLTIHNFQEYMHTLTIEGERALKEYGMLVIPGVELTKNYLSFKRSAHLLAIGISKYISADGSIVDLIKKIKDQGALAIAAHPVSTKMLEHQTYHLWENREYLADKIDAWEVASGPHLFNEVWESGLPLIASSDFHHPKQIKAWKTLMSCELSFIGLKTAIKEQKLEFKFYEDQSAAEIKNYNRDLGLLSNY